MKHELHFFGGSKEYIDADLFISPDDSESEWHFRIYREHGMDSVAIAEPRFSPCESADFVEGVNPPIEVWLYAMHTLPEVIKAIEEKDNEQGTPPKIHHVPGQAIPHRSRRQRIEMGCNDR